MYDKSSLYSQKYDAYGIKHDYRHRCKETYYDKLGTKYEKNYAVSKSTLRPFQTVGSKSTLSSPINHMMHKNNTAFKKDVSSLPYYIVPVLYVPHKPLYDAKEMVNPTVYQAYHCKSKRQLTKDEYKTQLTKSKSLLDLYTKPKYDDCYKRLPNSAREKKSPEYDFEYYDRYFKNYIDLKQSQSDISFYSDKSYTNLSPASKRSAAFDDIFNYKSKEKSAFDLPEIKSRRFSSQQRISELLHQSSQLIAEKPMWDMAKTSDASVGTEVPLKNLSIQTLLPSVRDNYNQWFISVGNEETQTNIQDITKRVEVVEEKPEKEVEQDVTVGGVRGDCNMVLNSSLNDIKARPGTVPNRSRLTRSVLPTYKGQIRGNIAAKKSTTSMM